nr:hypothetical protein [Clostridia bacterium]
MKKTISIFLALLLVLSLCSGAMADASVSFVGDAEKFVFLPGSEYSDSDLFENFKDVLPGDVLTQKITVKNDSDMQVRIYMKAEPVTDIHRDFLSQLTLKVDCADTEIFDAAASETAQLTELTLLGTFKTAGSTELTVTLTVPADLGNEYMGSIGIVPWTFIVEEVPDDDTPDTGDWFQSELWLGAMGLLAVVIAVLIVVQRRRCEQN